MKNRLAALLAALAMVGSIGLPAGAATPLEADAGTFIGIADVGKSGTCANDGTGSVAGGGIGLPVANGVPPTVGGKNAWYIIEANDAVTSLVHGVGDLNLCGRLTAPLHKTPADLSAVGASCAATKGWGGQGKAVFEKDPGDPTDDVTVWITELGWKVTVGGTFLVTAATSGAKGKKTNMLVAAVQALSDTVVLGCLNKAVLNDKSNVQPFTVVAVYAIAPNIGITPKLNKQPKK